MCLIIDDIPRDGETAGERVDLSGVSYHLYILYKCSLFYTIYGKEFERFCVNLKKIVEFVEKVLYNEDKLSEKWLKYMGNYGKVLA